MNFIYFQFFSFILKYDLLFKRYYIFRDAEIIGKWDN